MTDVASRRHIKLRGGGYDAIHKWLKYHYGSPYRCENPLCQGVSKRYHWAKIEGKEYEHKRENFMMLCASCHHKYDLTDEGIKHMAESLAKRTNPDVCRNGHPRTEKNTYWAQRRLVRSPVCRDCQKESSRRSHAKRES